MGSERAEYQRKYVEKHKEQIKEYKREYGKEWREQNREHLREYNRQYREDHREKIRINQNLTHNNINNKDTLRRVEEREEAGKILYECDLIDIKEKYQSIKDYTGEGEE